jgi:hypothetical protein
MGRPNPARVQTTTLVSVADLESRAQKPPRPQVPISVDSIPVTPAEAQKVPNPVPPSVAVETEK